MAARRATSIAPFDALSEPGLVAELAVRAEERGWDGFFVCDHVGNSWHPRKTEHPSRRCGSDRAASGDSRRCGEDVEDHLQFMADFAARLESTGEYIDGQALSPEGTFVRYDGEGRPPVTDGPFAETKDLIAGWMVIDVDTYERALALAGELSAAP